MESIIKDYPINAKLYLQKLDQWITQLCEQHNLGPIEQSVKWGEASFSVKTGSPIRMDWKAKAPEYVSLFFNCQAKLVDTFRELYGDQLSLVGNRELALPLDQPIPEEAVKHCLLLALTYKKVKHLPLLGA
ncbi:DUF1801 domain-containing protein [Salinibius halmophilus]|uniref:DUF1801 domain-containing protein n=1 Tax=Salinibius halmophilus TaxID=1853216 RepID=UPI000E6621D7|nr:DUF1801 domain-containing protein [Salinibius halmophilus]